MKTPQPAVAENDLPRTIWYMGAKARVLPDFLDRVLARHLEPGGTVLDLFSGTAIVSAHCALRYRVIANDIQRFALIIARSVIERPPGGGRAFAKALDIDRDLLPAFEKNRRALRKAYAEALALEDGILEAYGSFPGRRAPAELAAKYRDFLGRPGGLYGGAGDGPAGGNGGSAEAAPDPLYRSAAPLVGESSISRYRQDPGRRPACCLTAYYGNVYYGLRQAIDLDSLRAAIEEIPWEDHLAGRKRLHYLSALIHAASVTTSGTSHFAQPRQLTKDSELLAMARRRRLDVLEKFREFSEDIARFVASADLRRENRCLCADYRDLLVDGARGPEWGPEARADLVYMDPPYTADNYSRFYHVLEVLARYDYPPLERNARGQVMAGRYPEIGYRFQSGFCRPAAVEDEFRRIVAASANSGSKLVVSYGSPNGLLLKVFRKRRSGRDPVALLGDLFRERYREVEILRRSLLHSGQGDKNLASEELLVVCDRPR